MTDRSPPRSATAGSSVFAELRFGGPWRDYQARVLSELDTHWEDDHLHIVAPPGSGKTILGLEIVRRSRAPALVVVPTIPIQHQWVRRLSMFRGRDPDPPDWVSLDHRAPNALTVVTYQSLCSALPEGNGDVSHSRSRRRRSKRARAERPRGEAKTRTSARETDAALVKRLRAAGIRTLVLDEAHHLRREWWRVLSTIRKAMPELRTVALTATPPYDVDALEWERYISLCGPIDCEIFVPELVRAGDLCPHQDYVHFSLPAKEEADAIETYENALADVVFRLVSDDAVAAWLLAHPWIRDPVACREAIYAAPGYYVACLVVARHAGVTLPPAHRTAMLGVAPESLPELNAEWLERFLDGALREQRATPGESAAWSQRAERALRRAGVLDGRGVRLLAPREVARSLRTSAAKIGSVLAIVAAEHALLRDDLRMVILTDYIRKDALPRPGERVEPVQAMGAVPLFEAIRRSPLRDVRPAVLTGSLVLLPASAVRELRREAAEMGVPEAQIAVQTCDFDPDYVEVAATAELAPRMVACVTRVFARGAVRTLIGTAAYLGEGWDAPAANTLVLASTVSSYMLGNQMRGRVLRSDPASPGKAAHIWHLATVSPRPLARRVTERLGTVHANPSANDHGEDLARVARRFDTFEGVSLSDPVRVQRGLERLGVSGAELAQAAGLGDVVAEMNARMLSAASYRGRLASLWTLASGGDATRAPRACEWIRAAPMRRSVVVPRAMGHGAAWALLLGGAAGLAALSPIASVAVLAAASVFARRSFAALRAGYRSRTLAAHLGEVTRLLIDALHDTGTFHTDPRRVTVVALPDASGSARCRIDGAPVADARQVLDALAEMLDPPDDPRYLLVERSRAARRAEAHAFAVPAALGRRREDAACLARAWSARIAPVELLYTRTPSGRRALLRAIGASLHTPPAARSRREWEWSVGSVRGNA